MNSEKYIEILVVEIRENDIFLGANLYIVESSNS